MHGSVAGRLSGIVLVPPVGIAVASVEVQMTPNDYDSLNPHLDPRLEVPNSER
jgi:hypothetical protein